MYADKLDTDIHSFLKRHQNKDLLRFVTVGSVDDGKSTLIGRLLFDTGAVYLDHLEDARTGQFAAGEIDFARITDGLIAEREQGITIDVAYRYFTTPKRKFIIADTPGHIQYTRNMATGASTAELGIILIDAKLGVLQQSRRHAYIASLLGIPNLVVAINKMDLVDFDQRVYEDIREDFANFSKKLKFQNIYFIPVSALMGDNIVKKSAHMPWFSGAALLEHLETVDLASDRAAESFRYPVQYALRPNRDYRGFAGQIVSGAISKGDRIVVMPAGTTSKIKCIDVFEGEIERAFAPMSVTLRLEDEIDVSRGDVIVAEHSPPQTASRIDTMLVWMSETPLDTEKSYLVKHGARYIRAEIPEIQWKMDLDTLEEVPADTLALNDIARVSMVTHRALVFDPYDVNRKMGAFVVVDSITNFTVAAGMILGAIRDESAQESIEAEASHSGVSPTERALKTGHSPVTLVLTGGDHGEVRELAFELERRLFDVGGLVHVVDCVESNLDDMEAVQQIAEIMNRAGLITLLVITGWSKTDLARLSRNLGAEKSLLVDLSADTDDPEKRIKAVLALLERQGILA